MDHGRAALARAAFALTLTLALSAPLSAAQSAARARPLYQGVLEQCNRLGRKDERALAVAQLERRVTPWKAEGFGLEPLDTDRILASATALSALAFEPDRAGELFLLLLDIEAKLAELGDSAAKLAELGDTAAKLAELARPEPDLALALALGWRAFVTVPQAEEIPVEERAEHLTLALKAAEAIDATDARDALGCQIAHELFRCLSAAGRGREAGEMLVRTLARFPGDPESRPYLLEALADEYRTEGAFGPAWARLGEADAAAAELHAAQPKEDFSTLERMLAGARCQLELANGLIDRAALSLERERKAFAAGAVDQESHLDLLLNVSGVALAAGRPMVLHDAAEELDLALGKTELFAGQPAYRAELRARLALIQEMLAELEPGTTESARASLEAAFGDTALEETHRTAVGLRLFALALRTHALDAAEAWLVRLEHSAQSAARAPELSAALVAARARLALERHAGANELRGHAEAVKRECDASLANIAAIPARAGGLALLESRNHQLLLGTRIDLCLALDGDSGAEHAIDALLPEQALGSLAQRLRCGPGSLAEVRRELLAPDVGLLLYLPDWTSTHLFCLDAAGPVLHVELPWLYALEPLPRELAARLTSSPARLAESERVADLAALEGAARGLAQRLLPAAVQERLRAWRTVYVVGAEMLGGIPFECLPVAGEPLGQRCALAYLPSLPVGLELARRARGGLASEGLQLLLVAAPELAEGLASRYPGLGPLPIGAERASALCAPFERTLALTGKDASWTRLAAELAGRAPRVLHVLVHGVSDPERELSGGLALAPSAADPDGLLWCEELLAAEFTGPPLVILSACGSARGPRRTGDDGLTQLGGAFLGHGTLCTVQAIGYIALEPTEILMERFTHELATGTGPAEAMRLARRALAEQAQYAHPFYACSMRVFGLASVAGLAAPRR